MERYNDFHVWFMGKILLGHILANFQSTEITRGKNTMDQNEINICGCLIPANYSYVNNVWFQHVY